MTPCRMKSLFDGSLVPLEAFDVISLIPDRARSQRSQDDTPLVSSLFPNVYFCFVLRPFR